jgi:hypothetical protein
MKSTLAALLVGLLWGCTNPLIKRGAVAVEDRLRTARLAGAVTTGTRLSVWLSTPQFLIPQLANYAGSALFVVILGSGADISQVAPAANAVGTIFNAVTDLATGERFRLPLLLSGTVLVTAGVYLCGTAKL